MAGKKVGGGEVVKPTCYEIRVSGTYQTKYTVGDKLNLSGIKLTAVWTDGTTTELKLSDVEISGYDKNKAGEQTVSLSYGLGKAQITVTVIPKSTKITVSVTIKGDSKHGTTSSPHGLARGGLTTWASESGVEADTAETVWDVLQRVAKKHGITITASDNNAYHTVYISAVNGLEEFDNGKNSGWMYTVNGTHPEVGVSAKYLKNGDKIVLHYTDDYDYEEGGNKYGQKPSGGTTTGGGSTGGTTTGGTTGTTTGGTSGGDSTSGRAYRSGAKRLTRRSRQRRSTCFSCRTSAATVYTRCSSSRASMERRSTCTDSTSSSGIRSSRAAFRCRAASFSSGVSFRPSSFSTAAPPLQNVQRKIRFLKLTLSFPGMIIDKETERR